MTVARGTVTQTFVAGTDLDVLPEAEVLLLDGRVIDTSSTAISGTYGAVV